MTTDPEERSPETLNAEMKRLLQEAYDSGIDVKGGWECRNGDQHPDWDVIVTEVRKPDETE
jgi:hypothetical protein